MPSGSGVQRRRSQRGRGRPQRQRTHRTLRGTSAARGGSAPPPLRRSARLNPGIEADLSVEDRAAEAEVERTRTRRNRRRARSAEPARGGHSGQQSIALSSTDIPASQNTMAEDEVPRTYAIEVVVQPPTATTVGRKIYPPLAIQLRIRDSNGIEITGEDELNNLFAQATLYRESGSPPALAPPDMFLLSGRMSMSLNLLSEVGRSFQGSSATLARELGSYALFPDLSINQPGSYRLGVSLFKVADGRRVRSTSAGPSNGDVHVGGGISLDEVKSRVIVVQQQAEETQPDPSEQAFLDYVRHRGILD